MNDQQARQDESAMEKTRVLIIESDRDNMELMRYLMARQGYHVLEAYDGRQGLELRVKRCHTWRSWTWQCPRSTGGRLSTS